MVDVPWLEPARSSRTALSWYDFICPFCYVGQQRTGILRSAGMRVLELPYQAHPGIPPEGVEVGPRKGPMYHMLEREAAAAGLILNWPARLPDSSTALAAAEWVRRHRGPLFPLLHKRLFEAHFVYNEDLGDPELIDRQLEAVGIAPSIFRSALEAGTARDFVVEAEALGKSFGVRGTPAWLVRGRLVSGLRPASDFERLVVEGQGSLEPAMVSRR